MHNPPWGYQSPEWVAAWRASRLLQSQYSLDSTETTLTMLKAPVMTDTLMSRSDAHFGSSLTSAGDSEQMQVAQKFQIIRHYTNLKESCRGVTSFINFDDDEVCVSGRVKLTEWRWFPMSGTNADQCTCFVVVECPISHRIPQSAKYTRLPRRKRAPPASEGTSKGDHSCVEAASTEITITRRHWWR